jgi:16S rRNA (cytosine1402-N4)-methyltransferase
MVGEIVRLLVEPNLRLDAARRGPRIVDVTVGAGGHASALLAAAPADAELLGIDRDSRALDLARERLAGFAPRVALVHAAFSDLPRLLDDRGWDRVDLFVADLGVSSMQLDDAERGFSFRHTARLDMRMDPTSGETAGELVARLPADELANLLRTLGEEPDARRIARAIERAIHLGSPPTTTSELQQIVLGAVRSHPGRPLRRDPATLTFQALRIAVNHELEELESLLASLPGRLAPGARAAFLAYHSLEDRAVKQTMRSWTASCTCPKGVPRCVCGGRPRALALTRRALQPSPEEVAQNPRARSARLRAVEWLDAG